MRLSVFSNVANHSRRDEAIWSNRWLLSFTITAAESQVGVLLSGRRERNIRIRRAFSNGNLPYPDP
jgi:hypothetical protein